MHFSVGAIGRGRTEPLYVPATGSYEPARDFAQACSDAFHCGNRSAITSFGAKKLRVSRASSGHSSDASRPVTLSISSCTHAGSACVGMRSCRKMSDLRYATGVHSVGSSPESVEICGLAMPVGTGNAAGMSFMIERALVM